MPEAITDIADYIVNFTTLFVCIQLWATCHPLLSSINRQPSNSVELSEMF
jgi:hypothetical protein